MPLLCRALLGRVKLQYTITSVYLNTISLLLLTCVSYATSRKKGWGSPRARKERCICKQISVKKRKNISIKMFKDVGMTVLKIRETRSIYAATQGMRACNNNNMCNPKLSIYATTQGMRACNNKNMRNPPTFFSFFSFFIGCILQGWTLEMSGVTPCLKLPSVILYILRLSLKNSDCIFNEFQG